VIALEIQLANHYFRKNDTQTCLNYLKKHYYAILNNKLPVEIPSAYYYLLGMLLEKKKKFADAVASYRIALQILDVKEASDATIIINNNSPVKVLYNFKAGRPISLLIINRIFFLATFAKLTQGHLCVYAEKFRRIWEKFPFPPNIDHIQKIFGNAKNYLK
jgi:hypothetical protein